MPCNVSVRGAFQLTPSARRATVLPADTFKINLFQSTPSARRATWPCWRGVAARPISIHALREEGDMFLDEFDHIIKEFQSTPSARRATRRLRRQCARRSISIHALREEGDSAAHLMGWSAENFNPRPPRGGRRAVPAWSEPCYQKFQSTPSARRATFRASLGWAHLADFNPRPPRGERQPSRMQPTASEIFQSTPSARRATVRRSCSRSS